MTTQIARRFFLALLTGALSLGCSSSSTTSNDAAAVTTCQGANATGSDSAACLTCISSNCSAELSSVKSACGDFVTCRAACNCSDGACIGQCATKHMTATCTTAAAPLGTCQQSKCASACAATSGTDAGTGNHDTGGSADDAGAVFSAACQKLGGCCGKFTDNASVIACGNVVDKNDDATCTTQYATYLAAGIKC